jgi:3',5'-cyclic-AMP phosphodiesterase
MNGFSTKVLVMTDIHITKPGQRIIGLDPTERFRACLTHAAQNHPDADALVLTGDLTHHGIPEQYQHLRSLLDGLRWPVHFLIGNHDVRDSFRKSFPEAPIDPNGFVQSTSQLGAHRLVLLDTNDLENDPHHGGDLCPARLEWLRSLLDGQPSGSVVIMMHHPPFVTGFPGMDRIGLASRTAFNQIIADSPAVAMVVAGHVHRTIWGSAGGKPCAVLKSPCHQMPMNLTSADSSLSIDEPGAYGVLLLGDAGVALLSEDVGLPGQAVSDPDSV